MAKVMRKNGKLVLRSDGRLARCLETSECASLKCSYTVTFSGLAGDLAQFNGENVVRFYRDDSYATAWSTNAGNDPQVWLAWDKPNGLWKCRALAGGLCYKFYEGGTDPCNPAGFTVEESCADAECADPDTCENSAGATCTVS